LDVFDSHHSAITLKGHLYGLKHHILAQLRQCVVAQKIAPEKTGALGKSSPK